jgi:putative ABC transport system permease protein
MPIWKGMVGIWRTGSLDMSLAFRNVLRQRRRSAIGLGAVAAGVIAMLLASGFFEWNYNNMRERTIRARIGHVQVMAHGYADSGMADPSAYLMPESSDALASIESLPEVEAVAPRLVFNGLISNGESTVSFLGEGVDPVKERSLSGALLIRSGNDLARADEPAIIVGRGLAESLEVRVGQKVVLLVTTASGGINAVEVRVKGIFETATKSYDDYAIRAPLKVAQSLLRVTGIHMWLVLLHETSETNAVAATLRHDPRLAKLDVIPWYETASADFYNKTVSLFSKQVSVVEIMIGVIIVLSIANTMMSNVRERVGEIGTCMALGDRRSTVLRRFLAEGTVLGLLGGSIGVILGIGLARLISWIGIPMPPPPGMASGFASGILVTPRLVVDALALSISTAFLAGIYPAWRASRMLIHDALRQAR